ncbi:vacuolar protein-sorting-associated protein 25-like isoform X2 [Paramacrobiotus metropolitanus]|uniref:vacuolar protein-sorting-associated protein 25-like isoform X2 n=1 Tax=Paramacrobiotus metropolitanus TaxID=2943436 RepID=UPI002445DB43|nr:vacuolar protein-sorting-associated protein 25-like isoform X2 [Paramacrobiotus metropolitanus]
MAVQFPPVLHVSLQPNLDTRKLQLDAWCALVLNYHRANRLHVLDINEAQTGALFHNSAINRKLSLEVISLILDELRRTGNVEWLDKQKRRCWILWRSVDDWAKVIYRWAVDSGMLNTVCTLYELIHGHDTADEEFYGMDQELMLQALKILERQKKAELITIDGNSGVKFF